MPDHTETEAYLQSLPRLAADSVLKFACGPSVDCFNKCCGDLSLALSPYDVLRLRFALRISSKTFIRKFGIMSMLHGNQFPSMMLRMKDTPKQPCPFVREAGCSVYRHRPGACRVYPLGRGASIDTDGNIHEEYILVREPHCHGFGSKNKMTVAEYLSSQGMNQYIEFDNHYIQLMHHWNSHGEPLPKPLFAKVFMAMYRPDELEHLVEGDEADNIPSKTETFPDLPAEEAKLKRSMSWLETRILK